MAHARRRPGAGAPRVGRRRAAPDGASAQAWPGGHVLTLRGDTARLYAADAAGLPPGGVLHLCEGETDAESLKHAGARAVLGLPGAGVCHGEAVALAAAVSPRLCALWLDGDEAGRRAGRRLASRLRATGIAVRRWRFRAGQDVNDFLRAAPSGLVRAIEGMEADA